MSTAFFIVGFCIFSLYVYFLIWNIFYQTKKQREEGNGTQEYYERNYIGPKSPKRKKGSQSRKKNYSWHNEAKL
tara:strand:- start:6579 stop:6800 length:222 start_codon:yes stop_codon:yes gene_type:complete